MKTRAVLLLAGGTPPGGDEQQRACLRHADRRQFGIVALTADPAAALALARAGLVEVILAARRPATGDQLEAGAAAAGVRVEYAEQRHLAAVPTLAEISGDR